MIGLMLGRMPLDTTIHLWQQIKITSPVSMRNRALSMERYMMVSKQVNHGSMPASTTTLLTIKSWQRLFKWRTRTLHRIISTTAANISSSLSTTPAFFWSLSLRTSTVLTVAPGWTDGSMRPVLLSTSSGSSYPLSSCHSSPNSPSTS